MKKGLLLSGLLAFGVMASAQDRLVLYEEFTGESCPPCAATNPALDALMEQNADKILKIQYQVPIPQAGGIYNSDAYYQTLYNQRMSGYYESQQGFYVGGKYAPSGFMDGALPPNVDPDPNNNPEHPAHVVNDPSTITTARAVATPFTIAITNYSMDASGISATVTITSSQAVSNSNLKLRAALVETKNYATPPGTNGETYFPNMVQRMYPDPGGQAIQNSFTAGQSTTLTISGAVPSYVNVNGETALVVWIQDDATGKIMQAQRTYPALDIASQGISAGNSTGLNCGVPYTVNSPVVTIRNAGTTALTSATIYYKAATATTWQSQAWTGNLALGQTADVTLGDVVITEAGMNAIVDSVGLPNGQEDLITGNNVNSAIVTVLANSNGAPLPISSGFESEAEITSWVPYAANGDEPIGFYSASGRGHGGSNSFAGYLCYQIPSGSGYLITPFAALPAGPKALDFYVAYAEYGGQYGNDRLDIVYSTNCGSTWTSIWNKQGSNLATAPSTTSSFVPNGDGQWRLESVDLSNVPDGAQIAFKITSNYGNNMFIDDVNLRPGTPTGISDLVSNSNEVRVYPNPVSNNLNIDLNMVKNANVSFTVTNILGQQITKMNQDLNAGANQVNISTSSLTPGLYILNVVTSEGTIQKKFVKE